MVNTPDTATQKAYAAIALGFAARSCETKKLKWKDVIPMMHMEEEEDAVEKKIYKINYERAKTAGTKSNEKPYCVISGEMEVNAIDFYRKCFVEVNKTYSADEKLNAKMRDECKLLLFNIINFFNKY